MRTAGIDVDSWCLNKSAYTLMGPAAEARYLEKPVDLNDYAFRGDLNDLTNSHRMIGVSKEAFSPALERAQMLAGELLNRPGAWRAVLTLADALKVGTMDGERVAEIVCRELGDVS